MHISSSQYHKGDIVYYNVTMSSEDSVPNSENAEYEDNRSVPLIENPSDYYLSVIRYSINSASLPLFICPVIEPIGDPNNPNYTPFNITIQVTDTGFLNSQNIQYIPTDNANIPLAPNSTRKQDLSSTYYYVYFINDFLRMINITIEKVLSVIKLFDPAFIGVDPIYFTYNEKYEKIELYVPNQTVGGDNVWLTEYDNNGVPVFFPNSSARKLRFITNSNLYQYLESFRVYVSRTPGLKSSFIFLLDDLKNKNNYAAPPKVAPSLPVTQTPLMFSEAIGTINTYYTQNPPYFKYMQEYKMIPSTWQSVSTINILTASIPIDPQYIPAFTIENGNITGSNFRPILSDFIPDLHVVGGQRQIYQYEPKVYNYIELKSTTPIYKIDLKLFWGDYSNRLFPMKIPSGRSNTIKLMFIKRHLVDSQFTE